MSTTVEILREQLADLRAELQLANRSIAAYAEENAHLENDLTVAVHEARTARDDLAKARLQIARTRPHPNDLARRLNEAAL